MQRKTIATLTLLALLLLALPLVTRKSYSTTADTLEHQYTDFNDYNQTSVVITDVLDVQMPFTVTITNNLTHPTGDYELRIGLTNESDEENGAWINFFAENTTLTYEGMNDAEANGIATPEGENISYTHIIHFSTTTTQLRIWTDSNTGTTYNITGTYWSFDILDLRAEGAIDEFVDNFTAGTLKVVITGTASGITDYVAITGLMMTVLMLSIVTGIFAKKRGR